jgi:hypothetical protein
MVHNEERMIPFCLANENDKLKIKHRLGFLSLSLSLSLSLFSESTNQTLDSEFNVNTPSVIVLDIP